MWAGSVLSWSHIFMRMRSMTPLKSLLWPAGIVQIAGTMLSFSFICSMQSKKSAPMRSSLLTKAMRGTPWRLA